MYMMKSMLVLFVSFAIGYVLCILADKQKKGLLKTVGYILGIAIIAISLLCGAIESVTGSYAMGKGMAGCKMMKHCGANFMKGNRK